MDAVPLALLIMLGILAVPLGIAGLVYLVVPACKGIGWCVAHVFRFIAGEAGDVLRIVGSLLTAVVLVPLTVGSVLIGRWSGASHYGRAIQAEGAALGGAVYRVLIGHPARLFCLTALTEGIEKRIPRVVAAAPGADRPSGKAGQFEGYSIVGSLAGGGSGGKLYIAEASPQKKAAFARAGMGDPGQVVIKSFSLRDGSSLPQIVRENRALPAAKRLGLILEHELTEERFFYVMKYVPGESLGLVTQRLHAEGGGGLGDKGLREVIEYGADLVRTLCHYHAGGLWHKDVKPDNIIVAGGQAHLVDFGLITPLRSSMTLTTHGTEYFRDPEMVRLALRGVKVHEVDGARFDLYAAGAVLYSMVEGQFPAHGGLSQITQSCPEALRWIVRRAMTDYDKRYESAAAMLADLEVVSGALDPFAVRPGSLPSFREDGAVAACPDRPLREWEAAVPAGVGAVGGMAALPAAAFAAVGGAAPAVPGRLRVTNWWTGRYSFDGGAPPAPPARGRTPAAAFVRRTPRVPGATAAEQLSRARDRARSAQARAHARMGRHSPESFKPVNAGVGLAVLAFLVLVGGVVFVIGSFSGNRAVTVVQHGTDGQDRTVHIGPGGIRITTELPEPELAVADVEDQDAVLANAIRAAHARHPHYAGAEAGAGQAMVLRDAVTFGKGVRERIDEQVEALREAGFMLRGNPSLGGGAGDDLDPAVEDELIAELRNELGVKPFDTPEASESLRDWMDEYPEIAMVVWIGAGGPAEPSVWIVGRRGAEQETLARAAEAMGESVSARR